MDKMNELEKLGLKYGTDKGTKHNYLKVYYEMFKDRRDEIKKVFEIGSAEGAGLLMFRDFFPNATIYGLEIDQERVDKLQGLGRIQVFQGNQGLIEDICWLTAILEDVDIVIDDGSHSPLDQIFTCYGIMPFLKKGAIYIIEDVADINIIGILSTKFDVEVKKLSSRYDDRLIIIKIDE